MKPTAAIGLAVLLSACAEPKIIELDDIRDARGDTPGINTEINCDPAPKHIFDKHGEIIDTVHPILHPSCKDPAEAGSGLGALFRPGPGQPQPLAPFSDTDDDDDANTAAVDAPTIDTSNKPAARPAPTGPTTDPAPTPAPDPNPVPKAPEARIPKPGFNSGT